MGRTHWSRGEVKDRKVRWKHLVVIEGKDDEALICGDGSADEVLS